MADAAGETMKEEKPVNWRTEIKPLWNLVQMENADMVNAWFLRCKMRILVRVETADASNVLATKQQYDKPVIT